VVVSSLLPESKKLRTALFVGASIVFVGVVATILVMSADSGDEQRPAPTTPKTSKHVTADARRKSLKLQLGQVVVQNTGFPTKMRRPVRRAVMAATQRYFDRAIQTPLRTGQVNPAYSSMFDTGVNGLAAGRDRATLTEVATGPIRAPVRIAATPVRLDALGDPSGRVALVAASFALKINTGTPTGKLAIKRNTELTFAYESGRWRVTAYRVTVRRSIGANSTTTTARSGPGTTP
jgi:hypothetical protein